MFDDVRDGGAIAFLCACLVALLGGCVYFASMLVLEMRARLGDMHAKTLRYVRANEEYVKGVWDQTEVDDAYAELLNSWAMLTVAADPFDVPAADVVMSRALDFRDRCRAIADDSTCIDKVRAFDVVYRAVLGPDIDALRNPGLIPVRRRRRNAHNAQ